MKSSTLKWLEYVQLSSIPLRKLSAEKLPIGIASGCMIDYLNRRILLSVFHATGKEGNWAVELRFVKGKGAKLYYPGAFNFLAEMTLGIPEIRDVDFSYTEIPPDVESYFQELTPNGVIISERKRTVFRPTFKTFPTKEELYGFSGQILPEFLPTMGTLMIEHNTYPGLKYDRTEDSYHVFKLPVEHPGHERFEGCSGAPILDTKGNIVALVCSGNKEKNEIYGISLNKYKVALDITYTHIL